MELNNSKTNWDDHEKSTAERGEIVSKPENAWLESQPNTVLNISNSSSHHPKPSVKVQYVATCLTAAFGLNGRWNLRHSLHTAFCSPVLPTPLITCTLLKGPAPKRPDNRHREGKQQQKGCWKKAGPRDM